MFEFLWEKKSIYFQKISMKTSWSKKKPSNLSKVNSDTNILCSVIATGVWITVSANKQVKIMFTALPSPETKSKLFSYD